ncbi:MAG TPA: HAMP domain-containing protein, partial [Nannocystis sp.]
MSQTRGGLFLRIYVTFILTVIAFAAIVGLVVLSLAGQYDAAWVESVDTAVAAREPALSRLVATIDDPAARAALEAEVAALARELDLRAAIHDRDGHLLAGDPATRSPRALKPRQLARLQRGQPVVQRGGERGERGPALGFGIPGPDGSVIAVLALEVGDRGAERSRLLVLALLGLLAILAVGAWPLARSLTRRLAVLEEGAGRIARGELGHRIADPRASDELGRLGLAFNDMAAQLEAQVKGQRALLTNVSHELRTPVARMRVLAELLAERLAGMPDAEHPATVRVRRGIAELGDDLIELETLIADLLTSGRLDLGGAATLQRSDTELAPLLTRVAARVDARVRCDEALHAELDPVLIERLLANLLH